MAIDPSPFDLVDWTVISAEDHPGETGVASWRTKTVGDLRVRMVDYSVGYRSDHWCERGHVLLCLEGELHTELADGRQVVLTPGMSYLVGDGSAPHRSSAPRGARLFIVD